MKIKPLGDAVLLEAKVIQPGGGLTLPDDMEGAEEFTLWMVADVGPGATLEDGKIAPMPVKIGDEVIVHGSRIQLHPDKYDGRKLVLVGASSIWAIVERKNGELPTLGGKKLITPGPRIVQ
jgi:chaperonin GroES